MPRHATPRIAWAALLAIAAAPPATAHAAPPTGHAALACVDCHAPAPARLGGLGGGVSSQLAAEGLGPARTSSTACFGCHDGAMATDIAIRGFGSGAPSGDHPVGVALVDFSGRVLRAPGEPSMLMQDYSGGEPRWWIDVGARPGQRDAGDLILFTRDAFDGPAPFVECASCHDPHGAETSADLRLPNAGDALCRGCHDL